MIAIIMNVLHEVVNSYLIMSKKVLNEEKIICRENLKIKENY
jgi:hypothetical protein